MNKIAPQDNGAFGGMMDSCIFLSKHGRDLRKRTILCRKIVLILNGVTPSLEEYRIGKCLMKKFEKYNYLTIAENMLELDKSDDASMESSKLKLADTPKKFSYFTRNCAPDFIKSGATETKRGEGE